MHEDGVPAIQAWHVGGPGWDVPTTLRTSMAAYVVGECGM